MHVRSLVGTVFATISGLLVGAPEQAAGGALDQGPARIVPAMSAEGAPDPNELSNAFTTTSVSADGRITSEISATPVNYLGDDGTWTEIDNTFVASAGDQYAVENAANHFVARIPEESAQTPVKVSSDGDWVSSRMRGIEGAPQVDDDTAEFEGAEPSQSIEYTATNTGLKEAIVLQQAASEAPSYVFDLAASPGLSASLEDGSEVAFRDSGGDAKFTIPPAFMYDSTAPTPLLSGDVAYELESAGGGGWTLALTPSQTWLTDSRVHYPVVIDPTINAGAPIEDCWVSSDALNNSTCDNVRLRVGYASGTKRRSLVKFNLSAVPDWAVLASATLSMYLDSTQTIGVATADYTAQPAGQSWTAQATWASPNGGGASWTGGSPASSQHQRCNSTGRHRGTRSGRSTK